MATRRFSSRRRSRPRRKLVWARQNLNQTITIPVSAGDTFGVPVTIDALDRFRVQLGASPVGATIMRTRGLIMAQSPAAAAAAINLLVTMHVVDTGEIAQGADNADNAFSARGMGLDYFMFEPFLVVTPSTALQATASDCAGRLIDVKSSRKVEELNQTVALRLHGSSQVATTVSVTGVLSILLALP